ncbi:Lipoprotein-releasing system ATP-binding protein LolD [Rosistilla carotiformis]|uniref:Lipoprotein-releasing system ATP-binding protein LolD n=1 Tax=Rosistilla carotiformis TaxID=2528017 RepID=A0A518K0R4_9BACT|nr:ABC transporter ATP-binding protein [Rosistilla carotiformis]QDV71389.1 Lipoprotein-releasing system ATP-binding protein LolD [Rosistilla carotiformis]
MSKLVVEQVSKQYETRTDPLVVLRDVSLQLEAGQNAAIIGPSGSGKSTLLHILGSLDRPTSGSVKLDDVDPYALDEEAIALFRNQRIGFIFQEHHLLPQLSVIENVLVPSLAHGKPSAARIQRAQELLERVGLSGRLEHLPSELSGGERERVAVARALLCEPTLVLADEPTGNLDRNTAETVGRLLVDLQKQENAMLIVVTHSMALADLMQQRYELIDGGLQVVDGVAG